jgi:8-oxo-dGTP pyrophosphatase MutT (NUDIX family)
MDYKVGRNITTDTRPDRLPFSLLKQLNEGYDIASICIRHIISDMRAMKLGFGPMDDYDGEVSKDILEAKKFLRKPDGNRPFPIWLAQWMMDILRYDAGCLYRERNAAGKLVALKVVEGTIVAPIVDYYGDRPIPPAPFLQQFVNGIPWDWATTDDVIYEPHWPLPESPYGVAPAETIVLNANTDVRLQLFFLQFFTAGVVPEMLLEAPAEMTDPDAISELQEDWDNFYESNQTGRHGAHWVPAGTKPWPYKPTVFDPNLSKYVMMRSVAAFGLMPQDLGFTECYSEDTECLTASGWRQYHELSRDDQIATYNPETQQIEYHCPISIHIHQHKGEMVRFKSRSVDVMVTPHHRMWAWKQTQDRTPQNRPWDFIEAQDLASASRFGFVNITEGRDHQLCHDHVSRETYDGVVWCLEVPHHLFVTRRNGVIAVHGNTVNRSTADALADTQFRISTLPNTEIYEAIINMVIQDDLGLPVEVHFDTGREKKDRLMEAQAHQIYVAMGSESPDEVRDEILGLPVDNDNRLPRFYDSDRLGPVPLAWIMAVSGTIDPSTLSPFGVIPPLPFVPIIGQKEPSGPAEPDGSPSSGSSTPKKPKPKAAAAATPTAPLPVLPTGTKIPPETAVSQPGQHAKDSHEQVGDMHTDPEGRIDQDGHADVPTVKLRGAAARNEYRVDAGQFNAPPAGTTEGSRGPRLPQGSSAPKRTSPPRRSANGNALKEGGITSGTALAGIDGPSTDDEDDDVILLSQEARKELLRWRDVARKKAKDKKKQRYFESGIIPQEVSTRLHMALAQAQNREDVDKVFEAAMDPRPTNAKPEPLDVHKINGVAIRAGNTGRVLMLQRAMVQGDPAAGQWEFPGGHKGYEETDQEAGYREWQEETGIFFPKKAQLFSRWESFNGRYIGWVYEVPTEDDVHIDGREDVKNPDGDTFEAVAWFDPRDLANHPGIRPELKADIAAVQSALTWPRKKNELGQE